MSFSQGFTTCSQDHFSTLTSSIILFVIYDFMLLHWCDGCCFAVLVGFVMSLLFYFVCVVSYFSNNLNILLIRQFIVF